MLLVLPSFRSQHIDYLDIAYEELHDALWGGTNEYFRY